MTVPQAGLPASSDPDRRVYTAKEIGKRLEEWRVRLKTARGGFGEHTVEHCLDELNAWLDELNAARGR